MILDSAGVMENLSFRLLACLNAQGLVHETKDGDGASC